MSEGIGSIMSPLVPVPATVSGSSGGGRIDASRGLAEGMDSRDRSDNTRATDGASAPAEPVAASDLEKVVESINSYLQSSKRSLEFSVDDTSGRTVITVMDSEREEVIRQIPPEAVLALVEQFQEDQGLDGIGLADKA